MDESQDARQHGGYRAITQDPASGADHYRSGGQQGGQSSGKVARRPSRRNTGQSEPSSSMPEDPRQFNFSEPQTGLAHNQVYDYAGGVGESRINLQNTLGGMKASKRDVRGKGFRELSVHQPAPLVADAGVGMDPNRDSEDNNEGKYWRGSQQNDHGASRMLLVLIRPYLAPDTGGGSALNVGDGYHQGSQSRNPSRAFLCPVIFRRPVTFGTGVNLPNVASRDQLGQHNKSSMSGLFVPELSSG